LKHGRADPHSTPPSEAEGGIRKAADQLFPKQKGDSKNLGSWRRFGSFAAVGKGTRSAERNIFLLMPKVSRIGMRNISPSVNPK